MPAGTDSEVGHGTTFNLYLPRVGGPATEQGTIQETGDAGPEIRAAILVVEDDERVRRLTVSRLKTIGYQVLEARDGPEAMNILEGGAHVDLVFTDMIMPNGMSGRDVARAAKELKPGIKVLLTSGYAEDLARAEELERESLKVLRKPYRQSDLVTVLREVLAGTACQHGAKG